MGQLAQVAYQPYVARIGRRPALMTADYTAITSAGHAWVAEHCGRLAGLLVLAPAEDHLLLDNVAVAPDAQGLGVGTRLLRLAEKQAREQGLAEVRLYTNEAMTENLDYYRRRGYRETHRCIHAGYRRVFFTKSLITRGSQYSASIPDR
ncbi:MAG: GNAT family N-acetyltransferase [Geodermatophilaceae bacterium]